MVDEVLESRFGKQWFVVIKKVKTSIKIFGYLKKGSYIYDVNKK